MKAVRAEFVSPVTLPRAAWWCLVGLALICTGVLWDTQRVQQQTVHVEVHAQELRAQALEAKRIARQVIPVAPSAEQLQLQAFKTLRNVPWPEALSALEVTPRGSLVINAVQLDVAAGVIDVDAMMPDHESLLTYVELLRTGVPEAGPAWRWVVREVRRDVKGSNSVSIRGAWVDR